MRRSLIACLLALLISLSLRPLLAQSLPSVSDAGGGHPVATPPLPSLREMLLKLQTTARLLHTTAHPDDEDGGMMVLESHAHGASVMLLTLTRGEGGQNKVGSNLFDELGVLRTLELLASDRYYGAQQRFTRVADFGYSKNPEESFVKWRGHELPLEDMVRVIRTFRPDVMVSRFQGSSRDGHGHHQAAGILTPEAFRAAADSNRFPRQIREGLLPWQVKKLYMDNVRDGEDYDVRLDTGAVDPMLHMSYVQFAMEGLRHQLSQGAGSFQLQPGPHFSRYKLIQSALPASPSGIDSPAPSHENDFFDGIDTSLPGLASRLGTEQSNLPSLRRELEQVQEQVAAATIASRADSSAAAPLLMKGLALIRQIESQVQDAAISPLARLELLLNLATKGRQFEEAIAAALDLDLEVSAEKAPPRSPKGSRVTRPNASIGVAFPGETLLVTVTLRNHGPKAISAQTMNLNVSQRWKVSVTRQGVGPVPPQGTAVWQFRVTVPADFAYTAQHWRRSDPATDALYSIDPAVVKDLHVADLQMPDLEIKDLQVSDNPSAYAPLPFLPFPLRAHAEYALQGAPVDRGKIVETSRIEGTATISDPKTGSPIPLAVAPAFSILLDPATQVIPAGSREPIEVNVLVRNNLLRSDLIAGVRNPTAASGALRLDVPEGWRADSAQIPVPITSQFQEQAFKFLVQPGNLTEGRYEVSASLAYLGKKYVEGYSTVSREDLGGFYYYQPAIQRVMVVPVKLPQKNLNIGYIMGAGDDIPAVLKQIGMSVSLLSPPDLASGNLSRFDTIVLGIRAYDTRKDVRDHNQRLLQYVFDGGALIVQYNASAAEFNAGSYTPYPAQISRDRVSVEEAPVEVLVPGDRLFNYPNPITNRDFAGWVQERGLNFMNQWDTHFEPLLASHDPGEPQQKGGMMRARYGKGVYIFTGYAFFRQLPAGVGGAIRLYVNLLNAGR